MEKSSIISAKIYSRINAATDHHLQLPKLKMRICLKKVNIIRKKMVLVIEMIGKKEHANLHNNRRDMQVIPPISRRMKY